jgi:hypothetical protein
MRASLEQKCVQRPDSEEIYSSFESLSTCTEIDEIFVLESMKGHALKTMSAIEPPRNRSMKSLYF